LGWVTYGSSRFILVGLGSLRFLQVKHIAVTTLLPPTVRSVLRSCQDVTLSPCTPGSGGEDLAGGETNLTIGAAPRSRQEGPPSTTMLPLLLPPPLIAALPATPDNNTRGRRRHNVDCLATAACQCQGCRGVTTHTATTNADKDKGEGSRCHRL
jgi:hypothetical protein